MAARASSGPRLRVAAVLPTGDGLVVVRHRKGERTYHLLPGGGVERGETLEDALTREVREETGLESRLERLLFVNDTIDPSGTRHVVNLTFLCAITGGDLESRPPDSEIDAAEVVAWERLAELDLRPAIAHRIIDAAANEFAGQASYLGPVWKPETAPGNQ